jgi:hypothetical protein
MPGLVRVHRRIGDTVAATPVDELGLSVPDHVIGGLLPLLLTAPFFWFITARVRRILRWGLRSSAVVLVVNVLALPNNPEAAASAGYAAAAVLLLLAVATGAIDFFHRALPRRLDLSLVAGTPLAVLAVPIGQWLTQSGWPLLSPVSSLGFAAALPWACAAAVVAASTRVPASPDTGGRSLSAVLRRLTPDRAFSAVAVLIAAVSAWFSYQANQLQQDVRMRAQADQVVLMQVTTDDDASSGAVSTQDSERHVVVQNYSRLPVRDVWIVALPPAPRTAIAIEVGTMDSCEQAQFPRAAILAASGDVRLSEDASLDLLVWCEDASGASWQRHLHGPPGAREFPLSGAAVGDASVEISPVPGCVPA